MTGRAEFDYGAGVPERWLTPRRDSAEIKFFFADAPHVVAAMKAAEDALAQAVAEVERLRAKLDAAREALSGMEIRALIEEGDLLVIECDDWRALRAALADEAEAEGDGRC
jgi:hypothetical protein